MSGKAWGFLLHLSQNNCDLGLCVGHPYPHERKIILMKPIHSYSIAEARDNLTAFIREAEATVLAEPFLSALGRFREQVDVAALELGPDLFENMRQKSAGREPTASD